ncbi:hypothetical protein MD484_g2306, partial [Candolleomyces efflorescens]
MASNAALENYDDVSSSDSEFDPPFLQPVNKEELLLARAQIRAEKKAEKHAKADVFKRMGDELYGNGKFEEAYIPYLEATQIWPSNLEYYIRLSMTYAKLHWYEEAAHAATRALTLNPQSIEARYLRGLARLEQRLLTAAKKDLEIVVTHDKAHTKAGEALQSVNAALEAGTKLGTHTISPDVVAPSALTAAGTSTSEGTTTTTTATGNAAADGNATSVTEPAVPASLIPELDFSYPQYDDEALEVDSLSNTSDCNHRGNGVPCRFYNREGCAKGTLCPFSHAPDEKSVRDDLGRNVCTYFLLGTCKFGTSKCVYSHSRLYLPTKKGGWWTSKEETEKVKKILEISEKAAKEQRKSLAAQLQLLGRRRGGKVPKSARTPRVAKVPPVDGEEKKVEEAVEESGSPAESAEDTKKPSSESKDQDKEKKKTRKPYRGGKKSTNAKTKHQEKPEKTTEGGADNADVVKKAEDKAPAATEATGATNFTTEYTKLDRGEAPAPDVVLTY